MVVDSQRLMTLGESWFRCLCHLFHDGCLLPVVPQIFADFALIVPGCRWGASCFSSQKVTRLFFGPFCSLPVSGQCKCIGWVLSGLTAVAEADREFLAECSSD